MKAAVFQNGLNSDDVAFTQRPFEQRLPKTLIDGWNEFFGDAPLRDFADEFVNSRTLRVRFYGQRSDFADHVRILAGPAGLLFVFVIELLILSRSSDGIVI